MLEVKVTIDATPLVNALNAYTAAILGQKASVGIPASAPLVAPVAQPTVPVQTASAVGAAAVTPVVPTAPVIPAAPIAAPVAPAPPVPNVPLAQPPQYTIDQIMAAGTTLLDAGKITQLQDLLRSFGVQAVSDLKPEQYGAFATAMREMGAKI